VKDRRKVAVVGANGHTGRFVVGALKDKGLTPVGITRRPVALDCEEAKVADINDPDALDAALEGTSAVINCAGPFLDTSRPVVEAALRAAIYYLDLTAEQAAVQEIARGYDRRAELAGVVVMPAIAFFGGLADLLASAIASDWTDVDESDVGVALAYWHPTQGTRRTGARNTFTRLIVRDGKLVPVPNPPPYCQWEFPQPFGPTEVSCVPLSEVITISRHMRVSNLTSYMNNKPLQDLKDPNTPPPSAAPAGERSGQHFVMDVKARRNSEIRTARATGNDIYAVSAPLIAEACWRLLSAQHRSGVRSPGELFDAQNFLASLTHGIVVDYF
jgi:short subunit dehydrogenase-like uncharacterized protein